MQCLIVADCVLCCASVQFCDTGPFRIEQIAPDSHCLFRSIGVIVYNEPASDEDVKFMRSICVEEVRANWHTRWRSVIEADQSLDEYCFGMSKTDNEAQWGDHVEMQILAEYFNIVLHAISITTKQYFCAIPPENRQQPLAPLHGDRQRTWSATTSGLLVYHTGLHYNVGYALNPQDGSRCYRFEPSTIDNVLFAHLVTVSHA